MNKSNEIINYINKHIDFLLEQNLTKKQKEKYKKEFSDILSQIEDIKSLLGTYTKEKEEDTKFPYNYCEIVFDSEYTLPIPQYGLDKVFRTLKNRMFFNILDGDLNYKYLELKTKSLENTFFKIIIEDFTTFETYKRQKGQSYLTYKDKLVGQKVDIVFSFRNLK